MFEREDKIYEGDGKDWLQTGVAKEPVPWEKILPRMNTLEPNRIHHHIKMISKDQVGPFDPRALPLGYFIRNRVVIDYFGAPHGGKTESLDTLHDIFKYFKVPHVIRREQHASLSKLLRDDPAINTIRAKRSGATLIEDMRLQTQGGSIRQIPNITIYEQGPLSSLAFEAAYERRGIPKWRQSVADEIGPYIDLVDMAVVVRVPAEESKRRGSRMAVKFLEELDTAHFHMPYLLAPLCDARYHSMVVIDIDGRNTTPQDMAHNIVRSIGTVLKAAWRPAWS